MSAEAMVWGSLAGDALALGPHWIYEPGEIAARIGIPDRFHDPVSRYHPGKKAGDFTHYGDQALLLLRHLARVRRFGVGEFAEAWCGYWEDPATISYRDGATKGTLANLAEGVPPENAGAPSHDLAGASIIAPLFLLDWPDDASLVAACRSLAAFTHRDGRVIDAAEFFARTALACLAGKAIPEALDAAADLFRESPLLSWFTAAAGSARSAEADGTVLAEHGLSCDVAGGFPGVCHLLLRHPENPVTALIANAAAGGDSAARGMLLGLVYGAGGQTGKFPEAWTRELNAGPVIREALAALRDKEQGRSVPS